MERKFIKGDCCEDCFDSIELILQHFAPRLGNVITGLIPPVPLMHYQRIAEEDGTIFRAIVPFAGRISHAYIAIQKYNQKPVQVRFRVTGDAEVFGRNVECDKLIQSFYPDNWRVSIGSIIRIYIDPPQSAENIMLGCLLHPDMEHCEKEVQLISGLLAIKEQEDARKEKETS